MATSGTNTSARIAQPFAPFPPEEMSDPHFPQQDTEKVIIKHPSYRRQDTLLSLDTWDNGSGLHFGTVLLACQLVACNAFNGFLTTDRQGTEQIMQSTDSILAPGVYFFHVPPPKRQRGVYRYPIYACFEAWVYPDETALRSWMCSWTKSNIIAPTSTAEVEHPTSEIDVIERDEYGLDPAPFFRWLEKWFEQSDEHKGIVYFDPDHPEKIVDDPSNSVAVRADMRQCFDEFAFAIVRKEGAWMAHFLAETDKIGEMLHDRQVVVDEVVCPCFLGARFAWAAFEAAKDIIETGHKRRIRVRVSGSGNEIKEQNRELFGNHKKEEVMSALGYQQYQINNILRIRSH